MLTRPPQRPIQSDRPHPPAGIAALTLFGALLAAIAVAQAAGTLITAAAGPGGAVDPGMRNAGLVVQTAATMRDSLPGPGTDQSGQLSGFLATGPG